MTQPYKTCPQCGQPAILEMPQCRRCGFLFLGTVPAPGRAPGAQPHVAPRERSRADIRASRVRGVIAFTSVLLFACLTVAMAVGLSRWLAGRGSAPTSALAQSPMQAGGPSTAGVPVSPQRSAPQPIGPTAPGMFTERDSLQEMPTLYVTNLEDDIMTMTLEDAHGKIYQVTSSNGQRGSVTVPPGDYLVSVRSSNPSVQGNTGDAIFRRRKEYEAVFVHAQEAEPLHLGDQ